MDETKSFKIVICGLSDAGKTWIHLNFVKNCDYFQLDNQQITPTKAYRSQKKKLFNLEFYFWDLPGQKKYSRDFHLKNKEGGSQEKIYGGADFCIFVVDVTKPHENDQAQEELRKVIESLNSQKSDCRILILFHKWDTIDPKDSDSRYYELEEIFYIKELEEMKFIGFRKSSIISANKKYYTQRVLREALSITFDMKDSAEVIIKDFLKQMENHKKIHSAYIIICNREGTILNDGSYDLNLSNMESEIKINNHLRYKKANRLHQNLINDWITISGISWKNFHYEMDICHIKNDKSLQIFANIGNKLGLILAIMTELKYRDILGIIDSLSLYTRQLENIYTIY